MNKIRIVLTISYYFRMKNEFTRASTNNVFPFHLKIILSNMLDGIFAENKKPRILIVDYIIIGMNWPNPRSTCPWWSERN